MMDYLVPRFVKIWITPLAASVPNKVAPAAPLITSIRSISLTAMSFKREVEIDPLTVMLLSNRTLSTKMIGELRRSMLMVPLNRIRAAPCPSKFAPISPGTRPCKISVTV